MAKRQKAVISPKNNDDKGLQYALTVVLNYKNIVKDPQRISKIKPFTDQYNWKEIRFPSHKKVKCLNQIIKELPLISYTYHTIAKKLEMHAFQRIT